MSSASVSDAAVSRSSTPAFSSRTAWSSDCASSDAVCTRASASAFSLRAASSSASKPAALACRACASACLASSSSAISALSRFAWPSVSAESFCSWCNVAMSFFIALLARRSVST